MSIPLSPPGRVPAPGLSPAFGADCPRPTVSPSPQSVDQLPKTDPRLGPASEAHRKLLNDAVNRMASLSSRIESLPADTITASIKTGVQPLINAANCLLTPGTDQPSDLSVEHMVAMRDHMSGLRHSIASLRQAVAGIKAKGARVPEAAQQKAVAHELLQLAHQLERALASSLRTFPVSGPAVTAPWNPSDSRQLLSALRGANPGRVPEDNPVCLALQNWESVWRSDVSRALGLLPSAMLLSSTGRQFIRLQYEHIRGELDKVRQSASELRSAGKLSPGIASELDRFVGMLQNARCSLLCVLNVVDDYQSPNSVQSICLAKRVEIDAALAVLASEPDRHPQLEQLLIKRREAIMALHDAPGDTHAMRLLGKAPMTGVARLLRPFDALRQQIRLDRQVARMLRNPGLIADKTTLSTVHFSERQLLERLLKADRVDGAGKRLSEAISAVLDRRPWDVITSRIVIPVDISGQDGSLPVTTDIATSVVTPASHVLTDSSRIQFLSTTSPINAITVRGYEHTDREGRTIRGGFNSHDAEECSHAVMAAHTELRLDGKLLLGATRSGVQAPYGLGADLLRTMAVTDAARLIRTTMGPANPEATSVLLWGTQSTAPGAGNVARTSKIYAEFVTELGPEAGDLLDTREDDAALVKAVTDNSHLLGLMVRQAALHRARESFLVEISRTPEFAAQIASGETLSFMSLSLLTPDALRAELARHSPAMREFDEKTMTEIQVRAWQDLQEEINDGGFVVNGHPLKARLLAFNFGVNAGAVGDIARNPVLGEALSGAAFANQLTNAAAMRQLLGGALSDDEDNREDNAVDRYLKRQGKALDALLGQKPLSSDTLAHIERIQRDNQVVKQLRDQISEIWASGSYMIAGNEPYKLVSRLLVLHHLIGGGSQFNCKSGKDRTGQLDVEAKFLAFQIERNQGEVPKPDRTRTPLERLQFAAFVFQDEARRTMQAYATGYGGSKLAGVPALYKNFLVDLAGLKDGARRIISEFAGLAQFTKA